jgi:hypothetical protein
MANNLNQSSANYSPGSDQFLNNFYKPGFTVSSKQNDFVLAFFETVTGNTESAKILSSSVIYTAIAQGVDPIVIVEQMRQMSDEDRDKFVSMFLNFNRIGSSQLGMRSPSKYRSYIERLINPPPSSYADGSSPQRAASNALAIKELTGASTNGFYWIRGYNSQPIEIYCDMTGAEVGSTVGGWMRFDHTLVHRYRQIAIDDRVVGYDYNTNLPGAYNAVNPQNGLLRGIRWDLGSTINFTGVRIKRVKFSNIGGQDGWVTYDGPQPNWGAGNPTDQMVADLIDSVQPNLGDNFHSYGWSVGNGMPGPGNLVRLYKQAPVSEWVAQFVGLITLSSAAFYQYDSTDLTTGRYIYYYESDGAQEYNNLIDYTIWLR